MNTLAKLLLGRFSRRYDYDVRYLYELAQQSPGAFRRYLLIAPLAQYRKAAPASAYYAAKMVATRRADCGPCLNLVVQMAREDHVDEPKLQAILNEELNLLDDDTRLAVRYAGAVIDQAELELLEIRQTMIDRWGQAAAAEMSLAVTFGTFFQC